MQNNRHGREPELGISKLLESRYPSYRPFFILSFFDTPCKLFSHRLCGGKLCGEYIWTQYHAILVTHVHASASASFGAPYKVQAEAAHRFGRAHACFQLQRRSQTQTSNRKSITVHLLLYRIAHESTHASPKLLLY